MIKWHKSEHNFQFFISNKKDDVPRTYSEVGWKESLVESRHTLSTQGLWRGEEGKHYNRIAYKADGSKLRRLYHIYHTSNMFYKRVTVLTHSDKAVYGTGVEVCRFLSEYCLIHHTTLRIKRNTIIIHIYDILTHLDDVYWISGSSTNNTSQKASTVKMQQ